MTNLTLAKLLSLNDDQKIEAFERIANSYMGSGDSSELDNSITSILVSYTNN